MKKEKAMSVTITGYLEFSDLKDGKRYAQVLSGLAITVSPTLPFMSLLSHA